MSAPQPGRVGTISSPFWMTGGCVTRSSFQGTSSISISMMRKLGMAAQRLALIDRKSTRLNSSHQIISYAVFCLKKKKEKYKRIRCRVIIRYSERRRVDIED